METKDLICFKCKHDRPLSGGCDAFPEGIPNEILFRNKHSRPLKEQGNDIVFEPGVSEESKIFSGD